MKRLQKNSKLRAILCAKTFVKYKFNWKIYLWNEFSLPEQVFMSAWSLYPDRHRHSCEPGLLRQNWLQPPFLTLHSFTSERFHDRNELLCVWMTKVGIEPMCFTTITNFVSFRPSGHMVKSVYERLIHRLMIKMKKNWISVICLETKIIS